MSQIKELDEVLALVDQLCTGEQVKDLLRTRRGNENVRISAEDKDDLIRRNLRTALETKAIEIEKVYDLIRDAEENGNQHIFYYRASQKLADALTFEHVGKQLWGASWSKTAAEFPSIRLKPDAFKFSDFRMFSSRKPKDWILKIYGEKTIMRPTGKKKESDGSEWREFAPEHLRIILSARWNTPDLLEIRVQRNESRKRVEEWHDQVWSMISPAMTKEQFKAWDLNNAMRNIALQAEDNLEIYDFRDVGVIDDINEILGSFESFSDEGNLFKSQVTRDAIKGFLEKGGDLNSLAVRWFARPSSEPLEELRTLLGVRRRLHEILVGGHCKVGDLDYVTSQLRTFSKTKS